MRRFGFLVLLLCASAFADSDYQKATLISVTDASREIHGGTYAAGSMIFITTTLRGVNFNVQMGDVIYIGYHPHVLHWCYTATDFTANSEVYVRLDGGHMYVKKPNGHDCKTRIVSRIDKTDLGTDASADPKKEAAKHFQWGQELLGLDDMQDALTQMNVALRLNPDDADMHIGLGEAIRKTGDREKALEEFRAATRLKPKSCLAHAKVGRMLLETGNLEGALDELHLATQFDPRSAYAHYNYGAALEAKGDLSGALDEYKRVLKIDYSDYVAKNAVQRIKSKIAANSATPAS